LPKNADYYFTKPSVERALDEKILAKEAANHQLWGNTFHNVADAVHAAKKKATENDLIFIGGSSFVVADALPLFMNPS
jgi:dihydrofolate synthase/folylpolyglutamate synthase